MNRGSSHPGSSELERFFVVEVTGYAQLAKSGAAPGLSCHVLDRLYACGKVASFRSEDRTATEQGWTLGAAGAREAARREAARLNDECLPAPELRRVRR